MRSVLMLLAVLLWPSGVLSQPRVVASIVPVHALVAAVMRETGEPELLLRGGASPHDHALRPSDLRTLGEADVLFWIGPTLERFLVRPLETAGTLRSVVLLDLPGLDPLPLREGGLWEHEPHDAAHREEAHDGGDRDPHVWLDPRRAAHLGHQIAAELGRIDPANAAVYRRNAATLDTRLQALESELAAVLAPVREVPYVVFHDAYQYFERRFATRAAGSLTVSPERSPGARRVSEIRALIRERGARCVFREPQFRPALVETLTAGTGARQGVLDPLGVELRPGPEAYFRLLRGLAAALRDCLAGD